MTDNLLIDLPELKLPRDLARRVHFIEAVEQHARHLGLWGRYEPARFIGYYLSDRHPVVVAGHWVVTLEPEPLLTHVADVVERITAHRFSIRSGSVEVPPTFVLVHDRRDEACWLWDYAHARRFLEAKQPVIMPVWEDEADGHDLDAPPAADAS